MSEQEKSPFGPFFWFGTGFIISLMVSTQFGRNVAAQAAAAATKKIGKGEEWSLPSIPKLKRRTSEKPAEGPRILTAEDIHPSAVLYPALDRFKPAVLEKISPDVKDNWKDLWKLDEAMKENILRGVTGGFAMQGGYKVELPTKPWSGGDEKEEIGIRCTDVRCDDVIFSTFGARGLKLDLPMKNILEFYVTGTPPKYTRG